MALRSPFFALAVFSFALEIQAQDIWRLVEDSSATPSRNQFQDFISSENRELYEPAAKLALGLRDDFDDREISVESFLKAIQAEIVQAPETFEGLFERSFYFRFRTPENEIFSFGFSYVFQHHNDFLDSEDVGAYRFHIQMVEPVYFEVFAESRNSAGQILKRSLEWRSALKEQRSVAILWNDRLLKPSEIHFFEDPKPRFDFEIHNNDNQASDIRVAVIDQGIDYNHSFLQPHLVYREENGVPRLVGYDFMDNDDWPMDLSADPVSHHGTSVAGIIARGNPSWLKLLAYRATGEFSQIPQAIEMAIEDGARVINMSIEIDAEKLDELWIKKMQNLILNNPHVLFVSAAGNFYQDLDEKPSYPASFNFSNAVSVGSVDEEGNLSLFDQAGFAGSSYGRKTVDFFTVGENQFAPTPGGLYGYQSGTSFAAPQISAYAARVFRKNPEWSAEQVVLELARFVTPSQKLQGKGVKPGTFDLESFSRAYPLDDE